MRKVYLPSPLLFNIFLEILTRAIRHGKEIKEIQIGKEEIKYFLFDAIIILYLDPKASTKRLLNLINKFRKYQDTKATSYLHSNNDPLIKK
jgi:hypothetical protein